VLVLIEGVSFRNKNDVSDIFFPKVNVSSLFKIFCSSVVRKTQKVVEPLIFYQKYGKRR
jgi:hypothetical protein